MKISHTKVKQRMREDFLIPHSFHVGDRSFRNSWSLKQLTNLKF